MPLARRTCIQWQLMKGYRGLALYLNLEHLQSAILHSELSVGLSEASVAIVLQVFSFSLNPLQLLLLSMCSYGEDSPVDHLQANFHAKICFQENMSHAIMKVRLFFRLFLVALLKYNLHTKNFTHFKYVVLWFLFNLNLISWPIMYCYVQK